MYPKPKTDQSVEEREQDFSNTPHSVKIEIKGQ
jgi:hypothetical protein